MNLRPAEPSPSSPGAGRVPRRHGSHSRRCLASSSRPILRRTPRSLTSRSLRTCVLVGGPNTRISSNRRQIAVSSIPSWLVAAMTTLRPSYASNIWRTAFTTQRSSPCSAASSRSLPRASNSSKSATVGCAAMKSNTLQRFAAVSPRNEETTLSVRTTTKGRPNSWAITSAVSVLPQPGGPQKRTLSLGRRPWAFRTSSRRGRYEPQPDRCGCPRRAAHAHLPPTERATAVSSLLIERLSFNLQG